MVKHLNIHIKGKVQRIGFRYSALQEANRLNIKGYAENRPDGSVFIEAEGEQKALTDFLTWCHHGPPWAKVTEVHTEDSGISGFEGFFTR